MWALVFGSGLYFLLSLCCRSSLAIQSQPQSLANTLKVALALAKRAVGKIPFAADGYAPY